jgi:hypothetical protein
MKDADHIAYMLYETETTEEAKKAAALTPSNKIAKTDFIFYFFLTSFFPSGTQHPNN